MPAHPITLDELADRLAGHLATRDPARRIAVGVDGPGWADPGVADGVAQRLPALGRPVVAVDTHDFQRAASLRLERGRDDPDGYYERWFDIEALRREVLDPLRPAGNGRYLPTLWDPVADRATRAAYRTAGPTAVLVLRGPFLLAVAPTLDLVVHLSLSPAARARRVPADAADRELPALDRYAAEHDPAHRADLLVHLDDPRRPAVTDRAGLLRLTTAAAPPAPATGRRRSAPP